MPKISELDIITRLTEDDFFVVVDKETGTTRQITLSDILDIVQHVFNLDIRKDPPELVQRPPLGVIRTPGTLVSSPDVSPVQVNTQTEVAARIGKAGSLALNASTIERLGLELNENGFRLSSSRSSNSNGKTNYTTPANNFHHSYNKSTKSWEQIPANTTNWIGSITIVPNTDITDLVDSYSVTAAESLLTLEYDSFTLPNRYIVTAVNTNESYGARKSEIVIFDTYHEVTGTQSVNICKPAGYDRVTVAIKSKRGNSFEYTLTDTGTSCSVTPTPLSVTPTVTPTSFATPTPTSTPRVTPNAPTATPTVTPTSSVTPTVTPTSSVTPTTSVTPTVTPTKTPTPTVTPS